MSDWPGSWRSKLIDTCKVYFSQTIVITSKCKYIINNVRFVNSSRKVQKWVNQEWCQIGSPRVRTVITLNPYLESDNTPDRLHNILQIVVAWTRRSIVYNKRSNTSIPWTLHLSTSFTGYCMLIIRYFWTTKLGPFWRSSGTWGLVTEVIGNEGDLIKWTNF